MKSKLNEIPKNCSECKLTHTKRVDYGHHDYSPGRFCNPLNIHWDGNISGYKKDERHKDCPLIEFDFESIFNSYTDDDILEDLILELRTYLGE
jgi:hypothetical protein